MSSVAKCARDTIVHDLTPKQEALLRDFWLRLDATTLPDHENHLDQPLPKHLRKKLEEWSPQIVRKSLWTMAKHDDPDTLIVRFLRADHWNVGKALNTMLETVFWRLDTGLEDSIIGKGDSGFMQLTKNDDANSKKLGRELMHQLHSGKSFSHGTDDEGRPLIYIRPRYHNASEQSREALEKFMIYQSETYRMLLRSPHTNVTVIFDLTGFSPVHNMDWNALKIMASGMASRYPDSIGQLYVFRPPWIAASIWRVVKGWLPAEVASKVRFVGSPEELSKFLPLKHVLKDIGGEEDWSFEYEGPSEAELVGDIDDVERDRLLAHRDELVAQYENLTHEWADQEGETAHETFQKRSSLASLLRDNYWKLDPYVRARSVYDRMGVIGDDGSYNPLASADEVFEDCLE
ncbi:hypothetical protein FH972_026703 [Carpinus fangiana]|uniref:CRAL-TRIO domain-containing protein n=1 Tax=Carpinus fangiana TaxID=176857 RepID=A0A5N6L4S6_9ROSI|nr:hypothetical protein FH972_026703 [Carpinus fangiana]